MKGTYYFNPLQCKNIGDYSTFCFKIDDDNIVGRLESYPLWGGSNLEVYNEGIIPNIRKCALYSTNNSSYLNNDRYGYFHGYLIEITDEYLCFYPDRMLQQKVSYNMAEEAGLFTDKGALQKIGLNYYAYMKIHDHEYIKSIYPILEQIVVNIQEEYNNQTIYSVFNMPSVCHGWTGGYDDNTPGAFNLNDGRTYYADKLELTSTVLDNGNVRYVSCYNVELNDSYLYAGKEHSTYYGYMPNNFNKEFKQGYGSFALGYLYYTSAIRPFIYLYYGNNIYETSKGSYGVK